MSFHDAWEYLDHRPRFPATPHAIALANMGERSSALSEFSVSTQIDRNDSSISPNPSITSRQVQGVYDDVPLRYGPVRNIRLLKVAPETVSGLIYCDISTISIHGHQAYTAVSYVWGDDSEDRTILVGGRPFVVRLNLWHFLAQVHRTRQDTFFWIDTICIQQANTRTKSPGRNDGRHLQISS